MPTGTSMVVMTKPATRSWRSQDDLYRRSVIKPGSQRIQPVRSVPVASCAMRPGTGDFSEEDDSGMNARVERRTMRYVTPEHGCGLLPPAPPLPLETAPDTFGG